MSNRLLLGVEDGGGGCGVEGGGMDGSLEWEVMKVVVGLKELMEWEEWEMMELVEQ